MEFHLKRLSARWRPFCSGRWVANSYLGNLTYLHLFRSLIFVCHTIMDLHILYIGTLAQLAIWYMSVSLQRYVFANFSERCIWTYPSLKQVTWSVCNILMDSFNLYLQLCIWLLLYDMYWVLSEYWVRPTTGSDLVETGCLWGQCHNCTELVIHCLIDWTCRYFFWWIFQLSPTTQLDTTMEYELNFTTGWVFRFASFLIHKNLSLKSCFRIV